jgi:alkylation response protein AidB-like acyl-CoA dehydrogenase
MAFAFDAEMPDPLLGRAAALRERFHADAAARDQAGGQPLEQVRLLKHSGLLAAAIPAPHGGGGASWLSVLRIVRELARTDGSRTHLFGYHHLPLHTVRSRGTAAQRDGTGWRLDGFRPFSSGSHVAGYLQIAWEDAAGQRFVAAIPVRREGAVVEHDGDGIGQRRTGSGMVGFRHVRVEDDELLGALGALDEGRTYTTGRSRPRVHSGVERHQDDPWVQRQYGELAIRMRASTELADHAARALDEADAQGHALTAAWRGRVAIDVAAANVHAGETGLAVSSQIFELMGARSATVANGFDRFWRNVRTHTLHNPAEYKTRNVGRWLLSGEPPAPGTFQ